MLTKMTYLFAETINCYVASILSDPMKAVQVLIYIAVALNIAFLVFVIIKYFIHGKK